LPCIIVHILIILLRHNIYVEINIKFNNLNPLFLSVCLQELGINWKAGRVPVTELVYLLEEAIHCASAYSHDRDLFRAAFAIIRHEIKYLR